MSFQVDKRMPIFRKKGEMDWINALTAVISMLFGASSGLLLFRYKKRKVADSTASASWKGSMEIVDDYLLKMRKMASEIEEYHLAIITLRGQYQESELKCQALEREVEDLQKKLSKYE